MCGIEGSTGTIEEWLCETVRPSRFRLPNVAASTSTSGCWWEHSCTDLAATYIALLTLLLHYLNLNIIFVK